MREADYARPSRRWGKLLYHRFFSSHRRGPSPKCLSRNSLFCQNRPKYICSGSYLQNNTSAQIMTAVRHVCCCWSFKELLLIVLKQTWSFLPIALLFASKLSWNHLITEIFNSFPSMVPYMGPIAHIGSVLVPYLFGILTSDGLWRWFWKLFSRSIKLAYQWDRHLSCWWGMPTQLLDPFLQDISL